MQVFVTGSSGYVGGTVAAALLAAGHRVCGLVRTEQRAAQVRERGIEPAIGTLADHALLSRLAREADAVINAANADDRGAAEAMLTALEGTDKPFVHTSGSGIVADGAGGEPTAAIYEDDTPVHPLPARAARVALNDFIRSAAGKGVRTSIIAPSMIYGRGSGVNPNSIQIPKMIAVAKKQGAAKYVSRGGNVWSNVHIEDLADLYLAALDRAPAGAFYYAENGESSMREIAAAISRMLGFGGRIESMSVAEAIAEYGEAMTTYSFGSNSRVRAVGARRELGWSPQRRALLDDIEHGSYAEPAR